MNSRGRPRATNPRRSPVQVLFTESERAHIAQAAERAGSSMSTWLRWLALQEAKRILAGDGKGLVVDAPSGSDYVCDRCKRLEGCYCPSP